MKTITLFLQQILLFTWFSLAMPPKHKLHEDDYDDDGSPSTSLTSDLIERLIQTQQDSTTALVNYQKSSMSDLK